MGTFYTFGNFSFSSEKTLPDFELNVNVDYDTKEEMFADLLELEKYGAEILIKNGNAKVSLLPSTIVEIFWQQAQLEALDLDYEYFDENEREWIDRTFDKDDFALYLEDFMKAEDDHTFRGFELFLSDRYPDFEEKEIYEE